MTELSKHVIFILGGPGIGKSTQGIWLSSKYNIQCFAMGDLLKNICLDPNAKTKLPETLFDDTNNNNNDNNNDNNNNADLTNILMKHIKDHQLIDNQITFSILKNSILQTNKQCFIVEGYPRTIKEATLFDEFLECDCLIYMKSDSKTLLSRCQNHDENNDYEFNEEIFNLRLKNFHSLITPIIDYYSSKGKLREINGARSQDEVCADLLHEIRNFWYLPHLEEEPAFIPNQSESIQSKMCFII